MMDKTKLKNLVDSAYAFAKALEEICGSVSDEKQPAKEEKKQITLEMVRKVLADLSRQGYTEAVKNLITEFGANRLSDIPAEMYQEVIEKAEEITNG